MNKSQQGFVLQALDNLEDLSEWQIGFINSLAELPNHVELSPKQNKKLNEIQKQLNR